MIVIEPMPSNHGALPLFKCPVFPGFQSVFTPPLFQSYFDVKVFGFVVWGQKLANVSRFVAEIPSTVEGTFITMGFLSAIR